MMKDFPKNQIKYILSSKWNSQKTLEKAIVSFFYKNEKDNAVTKTDDLILLYVLGISNKARRQFSLKFKSWEENKDKETTYQLIKLFFLSSVKNKNRFKKEIITFLNIISEKDLTTELKPTYFFLKKQYLNEKINLSNIDVKGNVLSMVAGLFISYNHNQMRLFYETQIKLIDFIEKEKLSIYDKVSLLLFSENDKFKGLQLNKRDSLEYLRKNDYVFFYKFIKTKFDNIFFKQYKLWLIPGGILMFTILRLFGLLNFSQYYTGTFFKVKFAPQLVKIFSSPYNLLFMFLISFITIILFKLFIFLRRLKEQ